MSELRLALIGMGKMGRALAVLAPERGFRVVAEIGRSLATDAITRDTLRDADVAVEFTVPSASPANIRTCLAAGCPVVVGTTGWSDQLPAVQAEVRSVNGALLAAPNFSVGVAIFDRIAAEAARMFACVPGFDAHLVEIQWIEHRAATFAIGEREVVVRTMEREADEHERDENGDSTRVVCTKIEHT